MENNLAVLNLTLNILSPPLLPFTVNVKNMFQLNNSKGCPISFYQISQVIDNLSNKTLKTENFTNQLSLDPGTGNLNIFRVNTILDYNIFL